MSCYLEFSHLKPNETVKLSIFTLYVTFERIWKDFKVSCLAKAQVLPIAFAQVPTISQLYIGNARKCKDIHVNIFERLAIAYLFQNFWIFFVSFGMIFDF